MTTKKSERLPVDHKPVFSLDSDPIPVLMTHANSLNDFYVIRERDVNDLRKLNELLWRVSTFVLDFYRGKCGNPYACCWVQGNEWARIEVLSYSLKEPCLVRFLDFGNTQAYDAVDLRVPYPSTWDKPRYAYNCSLNIRPREFWGLDGELLQGGDIWAPAVLREMRKHLGLAKRLENVKWHRGVTLEPIKVEEEGLNLVDLQLTERDDTWSSALVKAGLAVWVDESLAPPNWDDDLKIGSKLGLKPKKKEDDDDENKE